MHSIYPILLQATEPADIEADSKFEPGKEGEAMMEISEQAPTSTLDNDPQLFDRSTQIDATHDEVFQPTEGSAEHDETKADDAADESHQVRGETLRIQPEVLTASVTQESLSETTAASSGYDSQVSDWKQISKNEGQESQNTVFVFLFVCLFFRQYLQRL